MNNRRIGILTFQSTSNFGSFFQTVGLYYAVKERSQICHIIDYKCLGIEKRERMLCPDEKSLRGFIRFIIYKRLFRKRYNYLEKSLHSVADCSDTYNRETIVKANELYDVYIVGSDLVWSLNITENDTTYFLDYSSDDKKKYSYASSIGKIPTSTEAKCIKEFLSRFDKISVREQNTADYIENILSDTDVVTVCDPTMLIYEKWDDIIDCRSSNLKQLIDKKAYILMYFVDAEGNMRADAKYLSKKLGYEIICVNSLKPDKGVHNIQINNPEDFLCLIKGAKLVLSGSYHGTLFSIYNRIPFFYYIRSFGDRMGFLSEKIGFAERDAKNIYNIEDVEEMDFDSIFYRINLFREESEEFLERILGN